MKNIFQDLKRKDHKRYLGGLDVFKYIGPGLLVTVGFIDPGNWASNFAAGSEFGDRKSTRLNSSHRSQSRMPSSA